MKWLEKIIDDTLDIMYKEEYLMYHPDPSMPTEMLDSAFKQKNDWKRWKPIPSILVDDDLNSLEKLIGVKLPHSYRHFLLYKHFYELRIPDFSISFPSHLPDKNLHKLKSMFLEYYEPEFLIKKGFIYFADFCDYGLLCFDSKIKRKNNEYPIVYIDHEDLTIHHHYLNNFKELMTADKENGNRFIMRLNEYYGH